MVGVRVGADGDLRAFELDVEQIDLGRHFAGNVGNLRHSLLEAGDGIQRIDTDRQLRDAFDPAQRQHREILDHFSEHATVADDGHHVIRRHDGRAEQAQLAHRADHAADIDKIANLERAQDQHERAGGKVAEQTAPGRPDRDTGAGQHRRERSRLDAEVAEDAEHQSDVQSDGDDRAEVLGQRRIDVIAVHRRLHDADDLADQPAADDPEGDGGKNLDRQLGRRCTQEDLYRLHVHEQNSFQ